MHLNDCFSIEQHRETRLSLRKLKFQMRSPNYLLEFRSIRFTNGLYCRSSLVSLLFGIWVKFSLGNSLYMVVSPSQPTKAYLICNVSKSDTNSSPRGSSASSLRPLPVLTLQTLPWGKVWGKGGTGSGAQSPAAVDDGGGWREEANRRRGAVITKLGVWPGTALLSSRNRYNVSQSTWDFRG